MRAIARTVEFLRTEGLWPTARRIPAALRWRYVVYRDHLSFDRRFGTDTTGMESTYLQTINSPYAGIAVPYEATIWREFSRMIGVLPIDRSRFTFVDLGSGKGRVLLFAALLNFPRIIGVEFAPHLVEIARRNITQFRQRRPATAEIEVRCQEIATFDLPDDNIVLYLYNPSGAELIGIVIDKLKRFVASERQLYVVYRNPKCARLFEAQPFLETIETNQVHAIYRGIPRRTTPGTFLPAALLICIITLFQVATIRSGRSGGSPSRVSRRDLSRREPRRAAGANLPGQCGSLPLRRDSRRGLRQNGLAGSRLRSHAESFSSAGRDAAAESGRWDTFVTQRLGRVNVAFDDEVGVGRDFEVDSHG